MAQRSLSKRLWYASLKFVCGIIGLVYFRIRCQGRHHVPPDGGVLVLSNHQSNLDPVLVGLACDRRLNYLARESLFGFPPFRWLIRSLDAIPIDREGLGFEGLKETLRRLRRGEMVLMFPEGTRSHDGEVAPLMPGFCAVAQRARAVLLPVGIDGSSASWPSGAWFPRTASIAVHFGEPIDPQHVAGLEDHELVGLVDAEIRRCHAAARRSRQTGRRGQRGVQ